MKTSHAWSLIVAFAVVLCVGLATPASARLPVTTALPDSRSGDIATLTPVRPPVGDPGDEGPVLGRDGNDGDPDDIMGGNNVVKGPMFPTADRGPSISVKAVAARTLLQLLRTWMSLGLAR